MLCLLNRNDLDALPEGIYDVTCVDSQISERLAEERDREGLHRVIPIAALFAGDFLCLDFRKGPKDPSVVLWDHERSESFKPHFELVDVSFTALVSRLRPNAHTRGSG
jgi:hypothetical protein